MNEYVTFGIAFMGLLVFFWGLFDLIHMLIGAL